jgi:hypothetical protein
MGTSPQFTIVPAAGGGLLISVNAQCAALIVAALERPPEGERPKDAKVREALVRELTRVAAGSAPGRLRSVTRDGGLGRVRTR